MNDSRAIVIAVLLASTTISSNARLVGEKPHYDYTTQITSKPNPNPMTYHRGPLLTNSKTLNVYLIWYGNFSPNDKAAITDFFASFNPSYAGQNGQPTVSKWWQSIRSYKDKAGKPVPGNVRLVKQIGDGYSLGKGTIKRNQIADLVQGKVDKRALPSDTNGIYLVLTSKDVTVERFCMSSCGFHSTTSKGYSKLVIAHVGDPSLQCPGFCAWPYADAPYGPPFKPLVAPNGVGVDGVVINIATVLAGAATNPFNDGYYDGVAQAPLEAVSVCSGKFGDGAFAGYPGNLPSDPKSNASYNVFGVYDRKFLVPAMWDLASSSCKVNF